jgi:hypothetical protein
VQQFYAWYTGRTIEQDKAGSTGRSWDEVLRLRPQSLSPELLGLLKDDLAASKANPDEIVGLDWDPFLASPDPSSKFEVESAAVTNGHCSAQVNGIDHGRKRETVMPELAQAGGAWVFVNFHYKGQPPPDENLISTLKLLRDERKKVTK